jgi:RNA polymerase sigma-70 factor (ECF subfamily)
VSFPTPGEGLRSQGVQDERALVERLKQLDPDAIQHVYRLHAGGIYRYALSQLGERAAAEDVVAEVFLRLMDTIERYEYRGVPLQAYLFRIARNQIVDLQRRRGRLSGLDALSESAQLSLDPAVLAEKRLSWADLQRMLTRLTDEQRQVVLLKFVEEMDTREIAMVMGKSEGAVKGLQHRAFESLRRLLETVPDGA